MFTYVQMRCLQYADIAWFNYISLHLCSGQILVDRGGRFFARAHREDRGHRAGDRVAARTNALFRAAPILVRDDAAPFLSLETRRGVLDERVRAVANGNDHGVHIQLEFTALQGLAISRCVIVRRHGAPNS